MFGVSAKTIFGDFPPSSKYTLFKLDNDEYSNIFLPTSPEPVNAITSTSICIASALPVISPSPVITLKTPSGMPASKASSASLRSVRDAFSAALITMELPVASAGANFQEPIIKGKFQGMIAPTTPIGSRWMSPNIFSEVGAISP